MLSNFREQLALSLFIAKYNPEESLAKKATRAFFLVCYVLHSKMPPPNDSHLVFLLWGDANSLASVKCALLS